jgi:hypothetical protein
MIPYLFGGVPKIPTGDPPLSRINGDFAILLEYDISGFF